MMDPPEPEGFGTHVIVTPIVTKYKQEKSKISGDVSPASVLPYACARGEPPGDSGPKLQGSLEGKSPYRLASKLTEAEVMG